MTDSRGQRGPRIDHEACLHGLSVMAGCADCIAACPHEALSFSSGAIQIDAAACNDCGACVGVCPVRAITAGQPPVTPLADTGTLTLVCQRHKAARGLPARACIQSAGREQVARWMLDNIRHIACATGDCETCPDAPAVSLAETVNELAPLAEAAGRIPPRITQASLSEVEAWRRHAQDAPAQSRRALLRAVVAPLREGVADDRAGPALRRLQSEVPADAPRAFVPVIDAATCTGCDACIRLCPEAALTLINDDDGEMRYVVSADACTGCLLCEDVCTDAAIEVDAMKPAPPAVALNEFRCRACGRETHVPAAGDYGKTGLCPVCERTGHHKKLFQVLA